MTAATIAPVSVADLHTGFGCCNLASVECPDDWQARAAELLSEKHSADVAEATVARVTALQAFLNEGPNPWAYEGHGGAMNVQPSLFAAAASCDLNESSRFDRRAIHALCGRGAEATA